MAVMLTRSSVMSSALIALFLAAACGSDVATNPQGSGSGGEATTATTSSPASTSSTSSGSGGAAGSVSVGGNGGEGGSAPEVHCDPNLVTCDGPIPECPPGEVPSVESGCWGACVPILSCTPISNCANCMMGFCAAYHGAATMTTEYRCVMPTLQCSSLSCQCVAPYFCVAPYDSCLEGAPVGDATCACVEC